ncbi:MAG TPA: hypothetical protein VGB53_00325 [Rubricoccaceae bacterium]|jgi:hypothetical protein
MSSATGPSSALALAAAFDALDQLPAIREELSRAAKALTNQATAGAIVAALEDGLHPDHAYAPEMACRFLGITRKSYLKVSKILLPRVGSGRVLGIDLMAYRGDVSRDEAAAFKAARRALVVGRHA